MNYLTGKGAAVAELTSRTRNEYVTVVSELLTMEGRCGGGIAWQDSFKHIHVSLDTRHPVSYGPARQSPHHTFNLNVVHLSETIAL